jgi:hypothetical protein
LNKINNESKVVINEKLASSIFDEQFVENFKSFISAIQNEDDLKFALSTIEL